MTERTYDDIEIGEMHDVGSFEATKAEMQQFAERYDPAPFHIDPEAAADSMYDSFIASGWYTASACMRLLVDEFFSQTANMGSFGLNELRWPTPVRAGDIISVNLKIVDKNESSSHRDRGYVENEVTGMNQDGEEVIYWRATNIIGRKE